MRAFIDTSALLALSRAGDQYHARAVRATEAHLTGGGRYVGTTLVLAELHAHLKRLRGLTPAREVIARLVADPIHDWREVGADIVSAAVQQWLVKFYDQDFTLTHAVSFEVMKREGVAHAFAFDHHFEVAGFELLG
jgi:predicted nucleic acid-binding protein